MSEPKPELSSDQLNALRARAMDLYETDDIQIDPLAQADVVQVVDGTWVRAWVWLEKEAEDETDST